MVRPSGLTVREASQQSGYNPEYIRRLIRQKKIKGDLIGQMYFIEPESLWAYVEAMHRSDDPRSGPKV